MYLVAFEEGRNFQGGPDVLQPVPVGDLGIEHGQSVKRLGRRRPSSPVRPTTISSIRAEGAHVLVT